ELFHPAPILTCSRALATDWIGELRRDAPTPCGPSCSGAQKQGSLAVVRAVVICAEPDRAADPGSVAALLGELGCRIALGRFDLGGLDLDELGARPPTGVIVEGGDDAAA